jgi:hypothetical protein
MVIASSWIVDTLFTLGAIASAGRNLACLVSCHDVTIALAIASGGVLVETSQVWWLSEMSF